MKVNHLLRGEREKRGWSQARVAQEIGTTAKNISRWERGTSFPYPYFRERLSALFGQSVETLGLIQEEKKESQQQKEAPVLTHSSNSTLIPIPYDVTIPLHYATGTGVIGRDDLLSMVKQQLKHGKNAMMYALSGLPGVGKTTLAAYLAHDVEVQEDFSDGILWAGLGPQPNVFVLLHRWGTLLGLPLTKMTTLMSLDDWAIALREAIGPRRMLLVLDDVWSIEDALSLAVGGTNCVHLMTTRFPALALSITSHEVIQVPELNEQASEQLLTAFAPNLIHQPEVVHTLVSLVGGLPLALHLMGRYLRVYTQGNQQRRLYAAIERLHNAEVRLRLHESYMPTERPPHLPSGTSRSLLSTIAVSVQQLDEQACSALFALSVFPAKPNTFSEAAALAVCALSVEALDVLNDAGLLENDKQGRYTMHQTISDYIRIEQQDNYAHSRMVTYFVSFVKQHQDMYTLLEQEATNVLAALHIAYEQEMHEEFLQGVLAFMPFLQLQDMYAIADNLLRQARSVSESVPSTMESRIEALLYQGKVAEKLSEFTRAITCLQEGLTLARQLHTQTHISSLLDMLGSILAQQGNQAEAERYLQEGLELARSQNDTKHTSDLLAKLGTLEASRGNLLRAEQYCQEGLAFARGINYRERVSLLLNNLGWIAGELKEYTQAEAYFREALTMAQAMGHRHGISRLLGNLAWIAGMLENYEQAEAYFQEALALAHTLDQRWLLSNILQVQGEMYLRRHALKQAEQSLRKALEYAPAEANDLKIMLQLDLARVSAASGDIAMARIQGEACLAALTAMKHSKVAEVQQWLQALEGAEEELIQD